jgi:hypothetical protein
MSWISKHFRRYFGLRPWTFCWRIGVESTVVSLVAAVLLSLFIDVPRREILDFSIASAFFLLVIAAPVLETLLLQALPIFIVRLLKGSMCTQILVSAALFAACHFPEGVVTGVSAGVIGGLYFAFAYTRWRTMSRWQAFWVTALAHSIHNIIVFLLLVILGQLK